MLALRTSLALQLHRLQFVPCRLLGNIGRKPRNKGWAAAAAVLPARSSESALLTGSSSSSTGGRRATTTANCSSSSHVTPADADPQQPHRQLLEPQPAGNFHVTAKELSGKGKLRLDAYLSTQLPDASRAKISASIKAGLITINRAVVAKPSHTVKAGDNISVALLPPEPCTAIPQDIPLDVVFEDDHLIVVNKAPGMVVHLSPGHTTGTLVNALLAHCGLPACDAVPSGSSGGGGLMSGSNSLILGGLLENDDMDEAEEDEAAVMTDSDQQQQLEPASDTAAGTGNSSSGSSGSNTGIIRPGIVHRLDRGTSGLMVVAKTDAAHAALCQQFKERSVSRIYNSITVGMPSPPAARVATNIVRDPGNRLRMMAVPYGSNRGRTAASNYQTLQVLAAGGAAVVQWMLETGRTHQIRVHAKHTRHPLLGDDVYGPNYAAAARQVIGKRSSLLPAAKAAVEDFGRPALHAKTLGFTHPVTRQRMEFDSEWPADFRKLYDSLQEWI